MKAPHRERLLHFLLSPPRICSLCFSIWIRQQSTSDFGGMFRWGRFGHSCPKSFGPTSSSAFCRKVSTVFNSITVFILITAALLNVVVVQLPGVQCAYFSQFSMRKPDHDPCYDSVGRPQRCMPDFINAAFGKPMITSSTCGLDGPSKWVFNFCYFRLNI